MKGRKVTRTILLVFALAAVLLVMTSCGGPGGSGEIQVDGGNAITVTVNNNSLKDRYNQATQSYEFVYGEEISLNYAEDFSVKLNYEDGTSKELVYQTDYNVALDLSANANVGSYSALIESNGYTASVNILIKPKPIGFPTLSETNFIYNGEAQGPTIDYHGFENAIAVSGDVTATEKGTYELSFTLNTSNYEWETSNDPSAPLHTIAYYVTGREIPKPAVAATDESAPVNGVYELTWAYDVVDSAVVARAQGITLDIPESYASVITVNGDLTTTTYGQYSVNVFLNNPNYQFSDGSTSFNVEYKINQLFLTKPTLTQDEYTYTGENVLLAFDDNYDDNLMVCDSQSDPNITYDEYGAETARNMITSYVRIASFDYAQNICWESETDCAEYPVEYYILRENNWLPSDFDATKVEFVVKYNKSNENLNSYMPMYDSALLTDAASQYLSGLDYFSDNGFYCWSATSKAYTPVIGDNAVTLIYSPHINRYSPQSLTVNVKLEKAEVDLTNFAWNTITEPYVVRTEDEVAVPYKFMIRNDVSHNGYVDMDTDGFAIDNPIAAKFYYSTEPFKTDNQFEDEGAKAAYWTSCEIDGDYDGNFTHGGYYKVAYVNIDREHYNYVQFDADNNKTEWTAPAVKEYSVARSDFDLSSMNGTALDEASDAWTDFYFYMGGPEIDCVNALFPYDTVAYSYYYSATSVSDLDVKFANGETISTTAMKERGEADYGYLKIGYYRRIATISYNPNDYNMTGLSNTAAVLNAAEGKIVITTDFEVTRVRLVSQAATMQKLFCYDNGHPLSSYKIPSIRLDDNYYDDENRPYTNDKNADLYEKYDSATDTWQEQDETGISTVGKYRTSSVFTVKDTDYYTFYEEGEEKSVLTLVHEFEILETPFDSLTIADSPYDKLYNELNKFKYSTQLPIGKELSIGLKAGYKIDMSIGGVVLVEDQTSAQFTYTNENKDSILSITIKDAANNVVLNTEKTCLQLSAEAPFDGITINGTAISPENNGTTLLHWLDALDFGKHESLVYRMSTSNNLLGWYTNGWNVPYTFTNTDNATKYLQVAVYYNSTTYGFESTALFEHLFKQEVLEELKIDDVKQDVGGSYAGSYDYWYDKNTTTQIKINVSEADVAKAGTIYYSLAEADTKQELIGGEVVLQVSADNTLYRLGLYRFVENGNYYVPIGEVYFYPYELALQSFAELKINDVVQTPTTAGTYEFNYTAAITDFNVAVSAVDIATYNGYTLRYSVGFASEMTAMYEMTEGSLSSFISYVTDETIDIGYIYYIDDATNTNVFIAKILFQKNSL